MLPILHLNGYKIANPTVLARISPRELEACSSGYGYAPIFVEGDDPDIDASEDGGGAGRGVRARSARSSRRRAGGKSTERPLWPMIVLRTPKGWTGPKTVDGLKTEGFWRAHQVPFTTGQAGASAAAGRLDAQLSTGGAVRRERRACARRSRRWRPRASSRMSANPHANGGALMRPLRLPRFRATMPCRSSVPAAVGRRSHRRSWARSCAT